MFLQPKKLIIVMDNKDSAYGELMQGLISSIDDKTDETGQIITVGPKDGSIDAALWTEKTYLDNLAQLSSLNKILFIGSFPSCKKVLSNMPSKNYYSCYGMQFGHFGNKGIITADPFCLLKDKDLYNEFLYSYQDYLTRLDEASSSSSNISAPNFWNSLDNASGRIGDSLGRLKIPKRVISVAGVVLTGGLSLGLGAAANAKEITEQQYRFAILRFYLEKLDSFMK